MFAIPGAHRQAGGGTGKPFKSKGDLNWGKFSTES
jgi:hypothetical protein